MPSNSNTLEARTQAAIAIARRFMASASAADRAKFMSAIAEGARGRALVASSAFDDVLRAVSRQVAAEHMASAQAEAMDRAFGTGPTQPIVSHSGRTSTFSAPGRRSIP